MAWEADCGGCGWKSSLRTLEEADDDAHSAQPSSDPVHTQPNVEVMVHVLRFSPTNVPPSCCAFKEICMCFLAVYSRSLCLFVSSVHFPPGELSLLLLHSVIIIHLLCMLQMF